MKAFFGVSAECSMRFALYSKMIVVHVMYTIHKVSPQAHVLADIQHQESDNYVLIFIYILPDSKKRFKIVTVKTVDIMKSKNL